MKILFNQSGDIYNKITGLCFFPGSRIVDPASRFSLWILCGGMMSDFRFLSDGHERALKGLDPKLDALRLKIKQEIEIQFTSQLAGAGIFKRWVLHLRMKQELKRRLAQIIKTNAPPDALY